MSEESKTHLIENNTREELDALATEEGVENPEDLSTKEDVAEAILAQRELTASAASSDAGDESQDDTPGDASPALTPDETPEDEAFRKTFGHLEGEALETAQLVWDRERAYEAEVN